MYLYDQYQPNNVHRLVPAKCQKNCIWVLATTTSISISVNLPVSHHPTWFALDVHSHRARSSAHNLDRPVHRDRATLENDIDRCDVRLCFSTKIGIRVAYSRWSNFRSNMSLWPGPIPSFALDPASILHISACYVPLLWLSSQSHAYSPAKSCSRSRQSYLADILGWRYTFYTLLSHPFSSIWWSHGTLSIRYVYVCSVVVNMQKKMVCDNICVSDPSLVGRMSSYLHHFFCHNSDNWRWVVVWPISWHIVHTFYSAFDSFDSSSVAGPSYTMDTIVNLNSPTMNWCHIDRPPTVVVCNWHWCIQRLVSFDPHRSIWRVCDQLNEREKRNRQTLTSAVCEWLNLHGKIFL